MGRGVVVVARGNRRRRAGGLRGDDAADGSRASTKRVSGRGRRSVRAPRRGWFETRRAAVTGDDSRVGGREPERDAREAARLVTDALRGQWAHQCGVQAGARLVSIDGTRLEGLDAAEIRLAASRASRPLWLDVQPGGHAPTGDALSGAHLLL